MADSEFGLKNTSTTRCVVFDLDETLIDSKYIQQQGFSRALNLLGINTSEASFHEFQKRAGLSLPKIQKELRLPTEFEAVYVEACDALVENVSPDISVEAMLYQLVDMGVALGVVTGKSSKRAARYLAEFFPKIPFECVQGYDSVNHPKPHPEHLLSVLREMSTNEQETIFAGDSVIDLRTALACDVRFCCCSWFKEAIETELLKWSNWVVNEPNQVVDIVGSV